MDPVQSPEEPTLAEPSPSTPSNADGSRLPSGKRRRRLLPRFGLRTLLVFAILFCLFFAWIGRNYMRLRQEEAAMEALKQLSGARFIYGGDEPLQTQPRGPSTAEQIGRILGYVSRPPTREMYLHSEEQDDRKVERALAALSLFPEIEDLHLTGPSFDDDAMAAVAKLPRLKVLHLSRTSVSGEGLASLGGKVGLEQIDLYVPESDATILSGVAALTELRSVTFVGTYASRSDVAGIASLPNLEEALLAPVATAGSETFAPLAEAKGLKSLVLYAESLGDAEIDAISSLPVLEKLLVSGIDAGGLKRLSLAASVDEVRLEPPFAATEEDVRAFSKAHPNVVVHARTSIGCFPAPTKESQFELHLKHGVEVTR